MISKAFIGRVSLRRDMIEDAQAYPFNLPALKEFDYIEPHPKVTFFVGENGSGKSTLLEAIAVSQGFNPEGGTKNFNFGTRESHSKLHDYLRIAKGTKAPRDGFFLRAESFFNVSTEIERLDGEGAVYPPLINAYGGKSLHEQSHGEAFLSLMMNRFGGQSLFILDEPEAALSPQRQLAVLTRIHELVERGSQFIIATHSPILMAYPDALILQFDASGINPIGYEETEHVRVTRQFLAEPKRMLDELLQSTKSCRNA